MRLQRMTGVCRRESVATTEAILVKACEGCTENLLHFSIAGSAIAPSEVALTFLYD